MQVDDSEKGPCEFIVGKPIASSKSATGRCTQGYIALHLGSETLMFLKDTWRFDKADIELERKTYRKLVEHNVPCVALFFCGDDIVDPAFCVAPSDKTEPSGLQTQDLHLSQEQEPD